MNVSLERPPTDLDLRILSTISKKPNVCTVPARVKMRENCPSLKTKYTMRTMIASTTQ